MKVLSLTLKPSPCLKPPLLNTLTTTHEDLTRLVKNIIFGSPLVAQHAIHQMYSHWPNPLMINPHVAVAMLSVMLNDPSDTQDQTPIEIAHCAHSMFCGPSELQCAFILHFIQTAVQVMTEVGWIRIWYYVMGFGVPKKKQVHCFALQQWMWHSHTRSLPLCGPIPLLTHDHGEICVKSPSQSLSPSQLFCHLTPRCVIDNWDYNRKCGCTFCQRTTRATFYCLALFLGRSNFYFHLDGVIRWTTQESTSKVLCISEREMIKCLRMGRKQRKKRMDQLLSLSSKQLANWPFELIRDVLVPYVF